MQTLFTIKLDDDLRSDLQLMATLSGCDKSYLIRTWIKYNKAWLDEFLKEHEFKPGRSIGLYWMAGPYNPAGIRQVDSAWDEHLKVKYAAQLDTIRLEKVDLEKQRTETAAEIKRLEEAQKEEYATRRQVLGNFRDEYPTATYSDAAGDNEESPEPERVRKPIRRGRYQEWWDLLDDEQQKAVQGILWGLVAITAFAAVVFFFVGHAAGRW